METNYRFYDLSQANFGVIKFKCNDNTWKKYQLKNVMDITTLPNFFITANYRVDVVKIRHSDGVDLHIVNREFPVCVSEIYCENFNRFIHTMDFLEKRPNLTCK